MRTNVFLIVLLLVSNVVFAEGSSEQSFGSDLGNDDDREFAEGISIKVVPGEDYIHKFPVFLFIKKANPPQMVLWAETTDGEYIDTLFVTSKIGKQSWLKAPSDPLKKNEIRRPESLPVWSWKRGFFGKDGLPLPDRDNPMPDTVSHASPKKAFAVKAGADAPVKEIILFFEVNHSTDFNDKYSADLPESSKNYNGGKFGSGQPSLVYKAYVNLREPEKSDPFFRLIGRGAASGRDGEIHTDMEGIDSALEIIESIEVVRGSRKSGDQND